MANNVQNFWQLKQLEPYINSRSINGILDKSGCTIDTVVSDMVITVSGDFTFFSDGNEFKRTSDAVSFSAEEGLHYVYYDSDGKLTETTSWSDDIIKKYCIVTVFYWDDTNKDIIFLADERHGCTMDSATHLYLHQFQGSRYESGLALTDIVADGDGSLDTHAQIGVEAGEIDDEDLQISIEKINAPAGIPVFYKDGSKAYWRKSAKGDFPCRTGGTGRLAFNKDSSGTWSQVEVSNNGFVLSHIFATNELTTPIICIQGQNEYTTIASARLGAVTEVNNIQINGLPTKEFVAIGTIIYQTSNSYSNTVKARIRTTDAGDDYVDLRSISAGAIGGGGASDHGSLSGLGDDDHTQYVPVDASRGFTAKVSGVDPTLGFHLATKAYVDRFSATLTSPITLGDLIDIDWNDGVFQKITLPNNCSISFTDPADVGTYTLVIVTNSYSCSGWDSSVLWPDGVPPKLSAYTDICRFIYDGVYYYGSWVGGMK